MITLEAPGKLFFAGEYAVLAPGNPAIVLAVDRTIQIHRSRAAADRIEIPRWDLDLREIDGAADREGPPEGPGGSGDPRGAFVARLFSAVATRVEDRVPVHLVAEPHRRDLLARDLGLGSSGTLALLFARALMPDEPIDSRRVLSVAMEAHQEAQGGEGSGADVAVAWAGRSLIYARDALGRPIIEALPAPRRLHFRALFSGKAQRTATAIRSYRTLEATRPEEVRSFCRDSAELVRRVPGAMERGGGALVAVVERLASLVAGLAATMGREPPIPSFVRAGVRAAGGAIKPSGAIGGDCLVVVARSAGRLPAVLDMTRMAGYEELDLGLVFS